MRKALMGMLLTSLTSVASAAVVDSTPGGFSLRIAVHVTAAPDAVYAALLKPSKWWNPEHTYSGHADNLSLAPRAGGCLCEKLPNGGSVQHLTLIYAVPGKTLRFKGALGPFQGQGVDGALTFSLSAAAGGTDLVLDNNYGGYMKGGFGDWPAKADGMLTDLMTRLKAYAEAAPP